jgi:anti-anti-sigma regulatory factor
MRAASVIAEVKETGHWRGEVTLQQRDERALIADMSATLLTRDSGEPFRIVATFIDITAQKQTEQELLEHRDRLEEMVQERTRTIREQADEILELSTPTMQVWDGILVAPLIGMLDSQRTQRFMEVLLNAIVDTDSESALIDLTGVPTIDTQTAQFIIETIEAVRLLGADVILTGVRPSIAQTLVHLGIDLSDITTRSSLVAGLRVALNTLGLEVNAHD